MTTEQKRLPWFPCEPAKLLGALAEMKPPEGYVYTVILLRIYERGGPIPDTLDALATRTKFNRRIVADAIDKLFKSGRLYRAECGGIMNPVADRTLAGANAFREKRKRAGEKGASRRWEKTEQKQRNGHGKAIGLPMANDGYLHLHKQEQKKDRENPVVETLPFEANGESVQAASLKPDDWPPNYALIFWDRYPRKTEKKAALEKLAAIRKSRAVKFEHIMAGVDRLNERVRRERTIEKYIKHPATWLNRGCWDDQFATGGEGDEDHRRSGKLSFGSIAAYGRAAVSNRE
jgi:hypothetical protein